jgi:hypothetical protein
MYSTFIHSFNKLFLILTNVFFLKSTNFQTFSFNYNNLTIMFNSTQLRTFISIIVLSFIANATTLTAQYSKVWQKTIGGSSMDELRTAVQLEDGSLVSCGLTRSNNLPDASFEATESADLHDAWVMKTDPQGVIQWHSFPGGSGKDVLLSIKSTNDGGFIAVGQTESKDLTDCIDQFAGKSDFWVVKLNSQGVTQWQRTFGGTGEDKALSVVETPEGSFVAVGEVITKTFGRNSLDIQVVKISEFGRLEWQKVVGGRSNDAGGHGVCLDKKGNILLTATTESNDDFTGVSIHGSVDAYVVSMSPKGKILWQKSYGGYMDDEMTKVVPTIDGGYLMAGNTKSLDGDVKKNHGESDLWLIKINHEGTILWEKTIGGSKDDETTDLIAMENGTFLISATTRSTDGDNVSGLFGNLLNPDAWILKLDEKGAITWQKTFGAMQNDQILGLVQCDKTGFAAIGYTESFETEDLHSVGYRDAWIMRFSDADPISDRKNMVNHTSVAISPNPAVDMLNFDLACSKDCPVESVWFTDASGVVVFQRENPTSPLYFGNLKNGIYFVHFKVQGKYVESKRVVVNEL